MNQYKPFRPDRRRQKIFQQLTVRAVRRKYVDARGENKGHQEEDALKRQSKTGNIYIRMKGKSVLRLHFRQQQAHNRFLGLHFWAFLGPIKNYHSFINFPKITKHLILLAAELVRAYKAEQKTINYAAAVVGGQVQLFINLYIYIYSLVIFIKKNSTK